MQYVLRRVLVGMHKSGTSLLLCEEGMFANPSVSWRSYCMRRKRGTDCLGVCRLCLSRSAPWSIAY